MSCFLGNLETSIQASIFAVANEAVGANDVLGSSPCPGTMPHLRGLKLSPMSGHSSPDLLKNLVCFAKRLICFFTLEVYFVMWFLLAADFAANIFFSSKSR